MFEFFIALFGGLFYGRKYLNEKETNRRCEEQRQKYNEIQKQIEVPPNYTYPKNYEEFWIMADSISDDLEYIFGEDWRSKLNFVLLRDYRSACKELTVCGTFYHRIQIAYEVWLASKGYIPYRNRYNFAGIGNIIDDNEDDKQIALRAYETIEKKLQEAHPDLSLRLLTVKDKPYDLQWEHHTISYDGTLGTRLW